MIAPIAPSLLRRPLCQPITSIVRIDSWFTYIYEYIILYIFADRFNLDIFRLDDGVESYSQNGYKARGLETDRTGTIRHDQGSRVIALKNVNFEHFNVH